MRRVRDYSPVTSTIDLLAAAGAEMYESTGCKKCVEETLGIVVSQYSMRHLKTYADRQDTCVLYFLGGCVIKFVKC
jgi:hypothetical protein